MPIFEYRCLDCKHEFELLVRGGATPACEKCSSAKLEKMLSLPTIQSDTTHGLAMRAAKRRDQAQGADRARAQSEYEAHHDD